MDYENLINLALQNTNTQPKPNKDKSICFKRKTNGLDLLKLKESIAKRLATKQNTNTTIPKQILQVKNDVKVNPPFTKSAKNLDLKQKIVLNGTKTNSLSIKNNVNNSSCDIKTNSKKPPLTVNRENISIIECHQSKDNNKTAKKSQNIKQLSFEDIIKLAQRNQSPLTLKESNRSQTSSTTLDRNVTTTSEVRNKILTFHKDNLPATNKKIGNSFEKVSKIEPNCKERNNVSALFKAKPKAVVKICQKMPMERKLPLQKRNDEFIDDDESNSEHVDYSKYIRQIFGYDKNKYRDEVFIDDVRESSFKDVMTEEARSTKLGILEDLEDIKMEKKMLALKQQKMQSGRRPAQPKNKLYHKGI